MSTVVKDLGAVSAYAYAAEKGYTGTEAEFAELMADYAEVGQRAEDAADSALESKTAAQTAATTATNKATEATTAATTATTKAAEASTSASTATSAKDTAVSAASTATTKATEATTAAATATSAKTDAVAANTAAQSAKTAAQTAQTGAETAAASVQSSAAQIATNAEDISQLKSDLGNIKYSVTTNGTLAIIPIMDSIASEQFISIKPITNNDVLSVNLRATNTNNAEVVLANLAVGEWSIYKTTASYTNVKVVYTLNSTHIGDEYQVIGLQADSDDMAGILYHFNEMIGDNSEDISMLENMVDSPFSVAVPASIRGIVAFEFLDYDNGFKTSEIEQYRLSRYYYKTSGFYMYLQIQRYVNGAWSTFDSITIFTANAPTETNLMMLEGGYHRFRVAYIPAYMTAASLGNVEYPIKNISRQPFITYLQNQIDTLRTEMQYGDYENQDAIKHVIHVDPAGNGDYTTIAAAYAAITDSSFVNQYEVILEPGTYEEYNLICPPYTHTHGYDWKTTIVTSENISGSTLPVFDQRSFPSKLSNMTIISGTGYCIHNDYNFINTGAVYNENLYCKKVYDNAVPNFSWVSIANPTIIGAGAQYGGVKIIYNNCTFEDGAVVCHSNSNGVEEGNFHFVLKNCKVVNAYIHLNMAGNSGAATRGMWICELDGLTAPVGCPALTTKVGARLNDTTWFGWQIIGGNNKNFAIRLDNAADTLTTDVPWDHVNTNEKIFCQAVVAVTKGQWITDTFAVASADENYHNIMGIALADAAVGDTFPVWIGNAYMVNGVDGEYGIGANGELFSGATVKIGKVISNIFYRY